MTEKHAYKIFRQKVARHGDRVDRVENVLVSGMPDINYCSLGEECWIELKCPTEPKRKTTPLFGSNHKVSQEQKNWFLRQTTAVGNAYFLIVTNSRWMLIDGAHADEINEMTTSRLAYVALWHVENPIPDEEWDELWSSLN